MSCCCFSRAALYCSGNTFHYFTNLYSVFLGGRIKHLCNCKEIIRIAGLYISENLRLVSSTNQKFFSSDLPCGFSMQLCIAYSSPLGCTDLQLMGIPHTRWVKMTFTWRDVHIMYHMVCQRGFMIWAGQVSPLLLEWHNCLVSIFHVLEHNQRC